MDYWQVMAVIPTRDLVTFDYDEKLYESLLAMFPPKILAHRVKRFMVKWDSFLKSEYEYWLSGCDEEDEIDLPFYNFCRISYIGMIYNLDRQKAVSKEIMEMTQ